MTHRPLVLAALLVLGLAVGGAGTAAILPGGAGAPPPPDVGAGAPSTTVAQAADEPQTLLVWAPGGTPDTIADALAGHPDVVAVTAVDAGALDLQRSTDRGGAVVDAPPAGMVIPLEAVAFDRQSYPAFLPAKAGHLFARLGAGEVILSETSARLRRLDVGGRLHLADAITLTVAAVVEDGLVGAAELAVPTEAAADLGIDVVRYLLVSHTGDRADLESAVRRASGDIPVRIRASGETPFLRHGDSVLPQVLVKDVFGEFAYRPTGSGDFEQEPTWEAEHITTEIVPLLGRVRCHRQLIAPLAGALGELESRNLGYLVQPEQFGGCWNPRFVANHDGISRHAWGIAVDLNTGKNPTGLRSVQDPRLVEVMERWGFTWGGHWVVPDPAHFEWLGPGRS